MLATVGFSSFVAAACLPVTLATLFNGPNQIPKGKKYDYVVIGAGPGGATIASRLSENPRVNVLLLEAGISNEGLLSVDVPFLDSGNAPNTRLDWNFTTVPQPGLNDRTVPYPRGRLLGGSSAINFMGYNRASQNYWDRIAKVTGDSGWSWDSLQKYFKKMEKLSPPADHHNTKGQIDASVHGTSGPLGISLPGAPLPIDDRVIATTKELSHQFPFNEDQNAGNMIGFGWTQSTIADGTRTTSATAYLDPVIGRKNLDVVVNAQATKLIQTGSDGRTPIFRGVQFAQAADSKGPRYTVTASQEVILSAGAVVSPQLLMLSGIGPSATLKQFGIKTIVNAPGVGQNLQDHPLLSNFWTVNSTGAITIDDMARNQTLFDDSLAQWQQDKTGLFTVGNPNQLGWGRVPNNAPIFKTSPDPSSGPLSPHFEYLIFNGFVSFINPAPTSGHFMTIFTALVAPEARGNITIKSANPFDDPVINPNILGTEFDKFAMRTAVNNTRAFVGAKAWNGWITGEAGGLANAHTEAELDEYAANNSAILFHPAGTAAIDFKGGQGVLNTDLTVKGTKGLRVVDLSVVPFVPEAHPQGAVYVIAERVADLIKHTCSTPGYSFPF
ncbi:hypothetical protein EVG20_g2728 [Dentipellis fragilis]|uniref:Glucose-methanol-choline oxidoreductase N-terminal domain-containing protein n=1 Tax=Dentipellis fragilis TaxID=205917 RepID=A0A4Y9Z748_9AGAM|nr:hypothetical protein EVG20_g2728 [Dentipellis fragilis]